MDIYTKKKYRFIRRVIEEILNKARRMGKEWGLLYLRYIARCLASSNRHFFYANLHLFWSQECIIHTVYIYLLYFSVYIVIIGTRLPHSNIL